VVAGHHDEDEHARLRIAPAIGFGELGLSAAGRF
jgi:hypothetical protein